MLPQTKTVPGDNAAMKIDHNIGTIIRAEMVRCGYTIDSLSQDTDISKAVLQGILTGRTSSISTRTLCTLARTFGYSAAQFTDLLFGNTQP